MRDSTDNLSFLSYHILTYESKKKKLLLRKSLLQAATFLQFQIKKPSKQAYKTC